MALLAANPTTDKADALRRRFAAAKAARLPWESRWQECYALTLPLAAPATGRVRTNQVNSVAMPLYDGTAADAVDQLAASLLAQLTPPWSRWFAFQPGSDLDPASAGPAASLLDDASRRAQAQFDRSNFLPSLLRGALSRAGSGASVIEHVSRQAKQARILAAFDAPLAAGMLHAHDSVLASALIIEMREWRPGKAQGRDDGLDAVAGCLLAEPVRLVQPPRPSREDWRPGHATNQADTQFDPLRPAKG